MAWRVESNRTGRWRDTGIIETNFEWATAWWTNLGRQWNCSYRLREV